LSKNLNVNIPITYLLVQQICLPSFVIMPKLIHRPYYACNWECRIQISKLAKYTVAILCLFRSYRINSYWSWRSHLFMTHWLAYLEYTLPKFSSYRRFLDTMCARNCICVLINCECNVWCRRDESLIATVHYFYLCHDRNNVGWHVSQFVLLHVHALTACFHLEGRYRTNMITFTFVFVHASSCSLIFFEREDSSRGYNVATGLFVNSTNSCAY